MSPGTLWKCHEEMRNRMPALAPGSAIPAGHRLDRSLADRPDSIAILLAGGALCNDASLSISPELGRIQTIGDPTEGGPADRRRPL